MKYVVFDFNGTVVDDVEVSLRAINHTIDKYLDRPHLSLKEYREVFKFPVKKYYEDVGFDFNKNSWEEVGNYWMDYYQEHKEEAPLHHGVKELLATCHNKGYQTVLLSASRIDLLIEQTKLLGIYRDFDEILGIDNIYASSKMPIALNFIKDKDIEELIYLGDSNHDKEVADAMGARCILIASGHESKQRLQKFCDEVYDDIRQVKI